MNQYNFHHNLVPFWRFFHILCLNIHNEIGYKIALLLIWFVSQNLLSLLTEIYPYSHSNLSVELPEGETFPTVGKPNIRQAIKDLELQKSFIMYIYSTSNTWIHTSMLALMTHLW